MAASDRVVGSSRRGRRSPFAVIQARLCTPFAFVVGVALALLAPAVRAQVIDMIDVAREGANAVVSIRFTTQIQYLRHAPVDRGDQIQVFFQFVGADESVLSTREEVRRAPPNQLVPPFDVTYRVPLGATQRRIDIKFATPVQFTLRPTDNRTIALTIPLPPETAAQPRPAQAAPSSPPVATEARPEVEASAAAAITQAREALRRNDFEAAVLALNQVLNLPPNSQSQEAQEQIGTAREKLGELDKAKVEYELYLKLYPEGGGAQRVRERLAALGAPPSVVAARPAAEREPGAAAYSAWGSVSQFYYGGQSRVQQTTTTITPITNQTTLETNQLSTTDQSQVITTADLNGRWKQGPWDNRVVFRDAYTWNFLSGQSNDNKLNAFYGETRYEPTNMLARAGRQIGTSGGVLGRFDGGLFSWGLRPDWRLGLVAGQLVDSPAGVHQTFAGSSIDADNFLGNTSGQIFGIYQRVAGVTDRVGLGGEARYFDEARTAYGLFDYDPTFRAVNIASFQGTWQVRTGTVVNVLADYRRSPTLQLANVVLAEQTTDIGQLLRINGESAVRSEAKAFTPISRVYLIGLTQAFAEKWQAGLDVRLSSLSGTPATAVVPATPGTGNVYTYTAQLIGTSLTRFQDILVVNGSVLRGSLLDGIQAGIDYRFTPIALLSVEPSFKYYHQTDNLGTRLTRFTPAIRVIYQLREHFSLEGEYDLERTRTLGGSLDSLEYRHFFYLGWRWEF
jgi:hypothetical protein